MKSTFAALATHRFLEKNAQNGRLAQAYMRPLYGLYMAYYTWPIYGLYTAPVRRIYGLYTAYIRPIYGLHTAYERPIDGPYTAYI